MKNPLKSKTLWVNMLVLGAGVLGYMQGHAVIQEYPQVVAIFGAVVGALNIALRFVTSKPIV
jgi:hypothetical protein